MITRLLRAAVCCAAAALPACSTLGGYPPEWHEARDSIHVYVSDSSEPIEIATGGEIRTVLDVVLAVGRTAGDLSRVVVFRRAGADMSRFEVDVRDMLLTGNTASNIQLQPGDVVGIAG